MSIATSLLAAEFPPRFTLHVSRRRDGMWVLDVSGDLARRVALPRFMICPVEQAPHRIGTFTIEDIPLPPEAGGLRCENGHILMSADYFNLIDTDFARPHLSRILHVRRPTMRHLLGRGWMSADMADSLMTAPQIQRLRDAAQQAADGLDDSGSLARELSAAPEPLRQLRRPKMSRSDWIALGALIVAVIDVAFGAAVSMAEVSDDRLAVVIEELVEQREYLLPSDGEDPQENVGPSDEQHPDEHSPMEEPEPVVPRPLNAEDAPHDYDHDQSREQ